MHFNAIFQDSEFLKASFNVPRKSKTGFTLPQYGTAQMIIMSFQLTV
tara:strand:+ start:120 stop:260 length:141 start_codon:yes stop_codon:yes gene_type:complete